MAAASGRWPWPYPLGQYLDSGDELLLQSVYNNYNGTFEYTKENFAFWQQLRSYTQGLTGKKKVVVVGCDIEHQPATALLYIRQLLGTNTPPVALADVVNALKTKNTLSFMSDTDLNWLKKTDVQTKILNCKNFI